MCNHDAVFGSSTSSAPEGSWVLASVSKRVVGTIAMMAESAEAAAPRQG